MKSVTRDTLKSIRLLARASGMSEHDIELAFARSRRHIVKEQKERERAESESKMRRDVEIVMLDASAQLCLDTESDDYKRGFLDGRIFELRARVIDEA